MTLSTLPSSSTTELPRLIAFVCCDGTYDDNEEMKQANEFEVNQLRQCADYVYYEGNIYWSDRGRAGSARTFPILEFLKHTHPEKTCFQSKNAEEQRPVCWEYVFQQAFLYIARHIKKHHPSPLQEWDLLVGCHTGKDKRKACDLEEPFRLQAGWRGTIPAAEFSHQVPLRALLLDCCCGNQIDMSQFCVKYILCGVDWVDYMGLVTNTFASQDYPHLDRILESADKNDPDAGWAMTTLLRSCTSRRNKQKK